MLHQVLIAAIMALAARASPIAPRQGQEAPTGAGGASYCSFGSSFASGYGIEPYRNPAAQQSIDNYPSVFAAKHPELACNDLSKGGSTLLDIPVRVAEMPADTKVVSITAGGNDLNYIGNLGADGAAAPPELDLEIGNRFRSAIHAIRAKAPAAKIVLLDYITIIGTHALQAAEMGAPVPGLPLAPERMRYHAEVAHRLTELTRQAAAENGAAFIEVGQASMEHGVGAPGAWSNGKNGPISADPEEAGASYHPNRRGKMAVCGQLEALYVASM